MTGESRTPNLSAERCGFSFSGCGTRRSMNFTNGFTSGKKMQPRQIAKTVSVMAIAPICEGMTSRTFRKRGKNHTRTSEPIRFESVCESAVRFASAVPPIAASQPVAVVPMFAPKRTAIATS